MVNMACRRTGPDGGGSGGFEHLRHTGHEHPSAYAGRRGRADRERHPESDERLLPSVVGAARQLGIGRTLMYELVSTGEIKSVHVGWLRKVPGDALAACVAGLERISR